MSLDEFALIRRYFAAPGGGTPDPAAATGVAFGIGDDAALLRPTPGTELVVCTDTLVAGRHFPLATAPAAIGWKALAVNLSDLAAMGAQPRWYLLALTLPEADADWLAAFADGLHRLAAEHCCTLVGGDTTRGPLAITITALGEVPAGAALRRDGARPGDRVCVTGTLGDAALALAALDDPDVTVRRAAALLRPRLDRPTPRVAAGLSLRGLATAAIDLSDGLAGDLGHLLAASGVGATLDAGRLPMSPAFAAAVPSPERRLALQAAGGDDYELCCTVPPERWDAACAAARAAGTPLHAIGTIRAEPGLDWQRDGRAIAGPQAGYRHFAAADAVSR